MLLLVFVDDMIVFVDQEANRFVRRTPSNDMKIVSIIENATMFVVDQLRRQ